MKRFNLEPGINFRFRPGMFYISQWNARCKLGPTWAGFDWRFIRWQDNRLVFEHMGWVIWVAPSTAKRWRVPIKKEKPC